MNAADEEVHPLDQDYTDADSFGKSRFQMPDGSVLRGGIICFSVGLASLLVTAAVLGVFEGVRSLEVGGSYMHQFSMVMILVGGILILFGVRLRALGVRRRDLSVWFRGLWKLGVLLLFNVLVWPLLYGLDVALEEWVHPRFAILIVRAGLTLLMVIAAMGVLLHQGWWRGFCVGVCAGIVSAILTGFLHSVLVPNAFVSGYYFDDRVFHCVWIGQLAGMVGAVYATVFERVKVNFDYNSENDAANVG
jgi:hypothetical protein